MNIANLYWSHIFLISTAGFAMLFYGAKWFKYQAEQDIDSGSEAKIGIELVDFNPKYYPGMMISAGILLFFTSMVVALIKVANLFS